MLVNLAIASDNWVLRCRGQVWDRRRIRARAFPRLFQAAVSFQLEQMMANHAALHADPLFEEYRPLLERLAYRMLGSLADADDVLQDAYVRWSTAEHATIDSPRAYLTAVVTRLCIDRKRALNARKEDYIGPWLPEPIVDAWSDGPGDSIEVRESVSMAMLVVLESLTPQERAAFLLRKVFDHDYTEIADTLETTEANCRQLVSRAEKRIASGRTRFDPDQIQAARITDAFLQSCLTGDVDALTQLLAVDAVSYSDGGGKVRAALAPILGADRVARFFIGVIKKSPAGAVIQRVRVNGQPGLMVLEDGKLVHLVTLDVVDGQVTGCFIMRNPDKLPKVLPQGETIAVIHHQSPSPEMGEPPH